MRGDDSGGMRADGCAMRAIVLVAVGAALSLAAATFLPRCASDVHGEAEVLASIGGLSYGEYVVEALPGWFEAELFAADGASELYATADGLIVGLVFPDDADERYALICDEMAQAGWLRVESGMDGCASFARAEGAPFWAVVNCVDVGDASSVVVQMAGVPR